MKRIVLMTLLALALPMAAFAGQVDFNNTGGTLAGNATAGLTLSGSSLTGVSGLGLGTCSMAMPCGSLAFTTGSLISGSLTTDAVLSSTGSSFTIMGTSDGLPAAIFTGSFTGNITWTEISCGTDGSICYTLSGAITGTWFNGTTVSGATVQITFNAGKNGFTGSVPLASGDTVITTTTPEPSTLGLLGTGLVALAGLVRKKLRA